MDGNPHHIADRGQFAPRGPGDATQQTMMAAMAASSQGDADVAAKRARIAALHQQVHFLMQHPSSYTSLPGDGTGAWPQGPKHSRGSAPTVAAPYPAPAAGPALHAGSGSDKLWRGTRSPPGDPGHDGSQASRQLVVHDEAAGAGGAADGGFAAPTHGLTVAGLRAEQARQKVKYRDHVSRLRAENAKLKEKLAQAQERHARSESKLREENAGRVRFLEEEVKRLRNRLSSIESKHAREKGALEAELKELKQGRGGPLRSAGSATPSPGKAGRALAKLREENYELRGAVEKLTTTARELARTIARLEAEAEDRSSVESALRHALRAVGVDEASVNESQPRSGVAKDAPPQRAGGQTALGHGGSPQGTVHHYLPRSNAAHRPFSTSPPKGPGATLARQASPGVEARLRAKLADRSRTVERKGRPEELEPTRLSSARAHPHAQGSSDASRERRCAAAGAEEEDMGGAPLTTDGSADGSGLWWSGVSAGTQGRTGGSAWGEDAHGVGDGERNGEPGLELADPDADIIGMPPSKAPPALRGEAGAEEPPAVRSGGGSGEGEAPPVTPGAGLSSPARLAPTPSGGRALPRGDERHQTQEPRRAGERRASAAAGTSARAAAQAEFLADMQPALPARPPPRAPAGQARSSGKARAERWQRGAGRPATGGGRGLFAALASAVEDGSSVAPAR